MKEYLLLKVKEKLHISPDSFGPGVTAQSTVFIKGDRIYQHKLARFYYTTYDVRRSEDVVNPNTPHCNIMLLANTEINDPDPDLSTRAVVHPFLYGRVIAIYHANVIYTGPGMRDYDAMRFDFLRVRWFQVDQPQGRDRYRSSWKTLRLDRLSFPPMAEQGSFGFVDPSLVLRSCHLIPAFSLGKARLDGIGLSAIAKDSKDWKSYYVNRFAVLSACYCYFTEGISDLLTAT